MGLKSISISNLFSPRDGHETDSAERDAEAEIARNLWRNYKLLTPTSPARERWDWILVLLVIFTSWQIPFVLVFNMPFSERFGLKILDYCIDFFFWADILLNFTTSYYVDEQLVTSRKEIMRHQFKSWIFYADVTATFPWDVLGSGLTDSTILVGCQRLADGFGSGNLRVLRLLRLLRLRRVVLKVSQLKGGVTLRFAQLIFVWFLIAHWTACAWFFIGKMGFQDAEHLECEGLPASNFTPWVVRIPPTGTLASGFSRTVYLECVDECVATCANNCTRISCLANSTCDDNNLNPDLSFYLPDEVWNQWLTSFYWALTMLMKMPNVGPDTTFEKMYSCLIVVVGAIFFALLLGQVTTLIMVMAKSGTQLRDQLVTMATFASSRRVPSKMAKTMRDHLSAEWTVTKGMDMQILLADFPTQLRGDVLEMVFTPLIEVNPPFMRCSEQLRRAMLTLFRPSVALKKQVILAGRQFGATMYVLMKGTLQVSQAPEVEEKKEASKKGRTGRAVSMGKADMKRELTRMNTKNYKDKLKVRMLEKPGAVIPLDTIFEGPRTSPFSVFAMQQSQMLTIEANELVRLLDSYPAVDAVIVTAALEADYKNLAESLKMVKKDDKDAGESSSDGLNKADENLKLEEKISKMESHARKLIDEVDKLAVQTAQVPFIMDTLAARMGVTLGGAGGSSEDVAASEEPVPTAPVKTGMFGRRKSADKGPPASVPAEPEPDLPA